MKFQFDNDKDYRRLPAHPLLGKTVRTIQAGREVVGLVVAVWENLRYKGTPDYHQVAVVDHSDRPVQWGGQKLHSCTIWMYPDNPKGRTTWHEEVDPEAKVHVIMCDVFRGDRWRDETWCTAREIERHNANLESLGSPWRVVPYERFRDWCRTLHAIVRVRDAEGRPHYKLMNLELARKWKEDIVDSGTLAYCRDQHAKLARHEEA